MAPDYGTAGERLAARTVVVPSGCWEWQGAQANGGYGKIFVGSKARNTNRFMRTHRLAWEIAHGPILDPEMCVCHKCDNRICCNPDHLFLGTRTDNMRDMDNKGRRVNSDSRGERNGRAVLTEANVREIRSSDERGVDLAARFGVCKSTVTAIRKYRLWKDVA